MKDLGVIRFNWTKVRLKSWIKFLRMLDCSTDPDGFVNGVASTVLNYRDEHPNDYNIAIDFKISSEKGL